MFVAVRKRLRWWELAGFVFVSVMGTLLQYLFRWSGESTLVAAFAAVNESTWEHMKMLYLPFFLFTMVEFTVFAEPFRNYFAAKAASGVLALLMIPVLFYTLSGALGTLPAWANVTIFYVAAAAAYIVSYRLLVTLSLRGTPLQLAGFVLLWGLALLFVLCSYRAPALPLFRDPLTQTYGIPRPVA